MTVGHHKNSSPAGTTIKIYHDQYTIFLLFLLLQSPSTYYVQHLERNRCAIRLGEYMNKCMKYKSNIG